MWLRSLARVVYRAFLAGILRRLVYAASRSFSLQVRYRLSEEIERSLDLAKCYGVNQHHSCVVNRTEGDAPAGGELLSRDMFLLKCFLFLGRSANLLSFG